MNPMTKHTIKAIFCLAITTLFTACSSDNEPTLRPNTDPGTIETIAGLGPGSENFGHEGDGGLAVEAKIGWITGITVDSDKNVYFTDGAANTVRKINEGDGLINTVAGTFIGFNQTNLTPDAGDGGPATNAHLNIPLAVGVDAESNIFVADAGNNKIRMVKADNAFISRVIGSNNHGFAGDHGPAIDASIANPQSVTIDNDGNIYFADTQNNAIRRIDGATGIVTTIAGLGADSPGYSGDGGLAVTARLFLPVGVAIDHLGNIFISDGGNNVVRKISNGVINTVAGTGTFGYSGDNGLGTEADFNGIKGIAVDELGDLYIADAGNHVIRKLAASDGVISTVAGNGMAGFSGDGGLAIEASLNGPWGVAIDKDGNLYIADTQNSAIRMVPR